MIDMTVVYDFIESIYMFIPVIAVISFVLILYFCGIGSSQAPPQEYLEKIQRTDPVKPKVSEQCLYNFDRLFVYVYKA